MITLYGSWTSPNVLKVRILLEEAGIDCEERRVKREAGENYTPEFLQISATGTLPAIVDEDCGARVFESSAIPLYLADKYGRFLPDKGAARADVFKWLVFEAANIGPAIETIYKLCYLDDDWVAAAIDFQKQKLKSAVGVLDGQLAKQDYVAGDCSIADFALYPLFKLLEDILEQPISDFPNLARWGNHMQQRTAIKKIESQTD